MRVLVGVCGCLMSLSAFAQVERVSLKTDGSQFDGSMELPKLSADGRRVVFSSLGRLALFVKDLETGVLQRVDGLDVSSFTPSAAISGNGRYVVFVTATALTADDTNALLDVYIRDLDSTLIERISLNEASVLSPKTDHHGRWLGYLCGPLDEREVCLVDRTTGERRRVGNNVFEVAISGNGMFAFVVDADGVNRVSLVDGSMTRIDVTENGDTIRMGNLSSNRDGSIVTSYGALVDSTESYLWVWDQSEAFSRKVLPNRWLCGPSISADGRWIGFGSLFDVFGPNGSLGQQGYLLNAETGAVQWVTRPNSGAPANNGIGNVPYGPMFENCNFGFHPVVSADGRVIAFSSWASNLVEGDTNQSADIFVFRRGAPPPQVSIPIPTTSGAVAAGLLLGIAGMGVWFTRRRWTV